MEETEVLQYVQSVARALDLPLNADRAQAVAQQMMRTVPIARLLESVPLAPEHELAEIYRPAPFPGEDE